MMGGLRKQGREQSANASNPTRLDGTIEKKHNGRSVRKQGREQIRMPPKRYDGRKQGGGRRKCKQCPNALSPRGLTRPGRHIRNPSRLSVYW